MNISLKGRIIQTIETPQQQDEISGLTQRIFPPLSDAFLISTGCSLKSKLIANASTSLLILILSLHSNYFQHNSNVTIYRVQLLCCYNTIHRLHFNCQVSLRSNHLVWPFTILFWSVFVWVLLTWNHFLLKWRHLTTSITDRLCQFLANKMFQSALDSTSVRIPCLQHKTSIRSNSIKKQLHWNSFMNDEWNKKLLI